MFIVAAEINEIFEETRDINIYNDGAVVTYSDGDNRFTEIMAEWGRLLDGSYEMPAFGVSIDRLTVAEMKSGLWLEFCFGKTCYYNEMDFEKLLVKVEQENYGFNIIRYNADRGYDGRCYYIDLNKSNMANLYQLLLEI